MDIQDHDIRRLVSNEGKHLSPVRGASNDVVMLFERGRDEFADHWIVVHDEYTTAGSLQH